MSGRDRILAGIRDSLGRGPLDGAAAAELAQRLKEPKPNLVPKRAQLPPPDRVELFVAQARELDVTISRVGDLAEIPGAVADYLAEHNLPTEIRMSPSPALDEIPWGQRPMLTIERGAAEISDHVGITPAFCAIAETGTLVAVSDAETPATLNFVPDNHIVVLQADQVVGSMEDSWARLRDTFGAGRLPRTVTLISGPSRTADIQLTLIKGAHGPRRLHIVLVEDGAS